MAAGAVLWSMAGVVTRHVTAAGGFEIAFWRSLCCALFILGVLIVQDGRGAWTRIARLDPLGWLSGCMMAAMFTSFMLALSRTTTANVLIVNGLVPLVSALVGRAALGIPVARHTWLAIALAFGGVAWMFGSGALLAPGALAGVSIAFVIPIAWAINVAAVKRAGHAVDLMPAILVGGGLSAAACLPFALPFAATAADVGLLALLGCLQLGLPFILVIAATRRLSPSEVGLLGLIETVLGPLWAWLGAGEIPAPSTLAGGAVVVAALVFNALWSARPWRGGPAWSAQRRA